MTLDLLSIEPTKISRDLREKSITIYGAPKSGKTTVSSQFPKALLCATEVGYRALAGVNKVDIQKWTDFTKILRQLDQPAVKEKFETIVIDTADILWSLAEKHVCNGAGVEKLSDVPFGALYKILADTFSEAIRSIPQKGYGVVFISHAVNKNFTDEEGQEYSKTVPTLNDKSAGIILGASDIIGYAKSVEKDGETKTALFLRETPRFTAGSRFKYTPSVIEFKYESLVNAIADAIEKEAQIDAEAVTSDAHKIKETVEKSFDEVKAEIDRIIALLMEGKEPEVQQLRGAEIKKIVESHLGKNKMLKDTTEDQRDHIELVLLDLQDLIEQP